MSFTNQLCQFWLAPSHRTRYVFCSYSANSSAGTAQRLSATEGRSGRTTTNKEHQAGKVNLLVLFPLQLRSHTPSSSSLYSAVRQIGFASYNTPVKLDSSSCSLQSWCFHWYELQDSRINFQDFQGMLGLSAECRNVKIQSSVWKVLAFQLEPCREDSVPVQQLAMLPPSETN